MTVLSLLLLILGILVVGTICYWVITKFFPEPMRMLALAVVGILLLLVLLSQFFPGAAGLRIWR